MKTMQRRPDLQGGSARVRSAVRLAVGLAGLLAVMLFAGAAEGAPVPRTPQRMRTSARVAAEPKPVRGRAVARKDAGSWGGNSRTSARAERGRSIHAEQVKVASRGKGRATPGKASAKETKASVNAERSRLQTERPRVRRLGEVDTAPATTYRARAEKIKQEDEKPVASEVSEQKKLTVEDFEKAASGPRETVAPVEPAETPEAKAAAVKPLTKSLVRAANEKLAAERAASERAAAEKAATDKAADAEIAEAHRMAARPAGQRLPMWASGAGAPAATQRSVVIVRPPMKTVAAPAKSAEVANAMPQVQANRPKAAVMARATALPRLEAAGNEHDAADAVKGSDEVADVSDADEPTTPRAGLFSKGAATRAAVSVDSESGNFDSEDVTPVKRSPGMREATHEEMAAAAVQPMVLPGLYRDGRLMVPAPLRGTREILVHQNTMADEEGLERIRNDSDLNRLRAAHELVNLQESVSLRVNPELSANRRCARVWSVQFAEDMSRAFYARFHEPLQVNSAVRTVAFQVRLRRVNGNAAATEGDGASPHLTGQALDFGKHGMSVEELAWMRLYLLPLMQAGKLDVEEEFQQACFHISVYRSYLQSAPTRRRGAIRNEVAQLRSEKAVKSAPPSDEDDNDQQ